uniref:Uncharacterized protein n=1 Tax=Pararge aegeria TaxID=116150 RepID=S4PD94_9NEOP
MLTSMAEQNSNTIRSVKFSLRIVYNRSSTHIRLDLSTVAMSLCCLSSPSIVFYIINLIYFYSEELVNQFQVSMTFDCSDIDLLSSVLTIFIKWK